MKRLVPMYPWPMHPKVAAILDAIPNINPVEALPGGPGPVLAVGKPPTFACDAIVVKTPERTAEAVNIIIADGIEFVSMGEILGRPWGKKARELAPERVESKVKFR